MVFGVISTQLESRYARFGHHLQDQHFAGMVLLAFFLHLGGVMLFSLLPDKPVAEVPVRVLNVKLGGYQEIAEDARQGKTAPVSDRQLQYLEPSAGTPADSKIKTNDTKEKAALSAFESQLKKTAKMAPAEPEKKPIKPSKPNAKQAPLSKATPTKKLAAATQPKQFIRDVTIQGKEDAFASGPAGKGSVLGNTTSAAEAAEIETRYTQTLSLWLERHKIYPAEAQKLGQQGRAVLRIRIDRRGNVLRWRLDESSGHPIIDQAMTGIVSAANPFPPVPANYPDPSPVLEYLIPIRFKL
jgi:periplasmic protein TonB